MYRDTRSGEEAGNQTRYPPAPLLPPAVGAVLGTVTDWAVQPNRAACLALAGAVALAMSIAPGRGVRRVLLIALAACAAALHHAAEFRHLPADHIARCVGHHSYPALLRGRISAPPRLLPPRSGRGPQQTFELEVTAARISTAWVAVSGQVLVNARQPVAALQEGMWLDVFGTLYAPASPGNPGTFDWALALRRRGIHAGMVCSHAAAIEIRTPPHDPWIRWLRRLRWQTRAALLERVEPPSPGPQSVLDAMVLGRRAGLPQDVQEAFRRSGTAHFLALSGMHVALLGGFVWGVSRLAGCPRRAAAGAVLAALTAYALLVEPRPSVIRATVMAAVHCGGILLRRPGNAINSIALAAVILLVGNPMQVFDPGFQLSFVVALSIPQVTPHVSALLRRRWQNRLAAAPPDPMSRKIGVAVLRRSGPWTRLWGRLRQAVGQAFLNLWCVGAVAWLAGAPLAALHFNSFCAYGWPFTLILSPFVLMTMIIAFAKILCTGIWPSTALVSGPLLEVNTATLLAVVNALSAAPGAAVDVPSPSWLWIVGYYAWAALWVHQRRRGTPHRYRRTRRLAAAGLALTAASAWLPPASHQDLRLTLWSVGPGSATLLELPDGQACLYDAGSLWATDLGRRTLMPLLRQRRVRRLATAVISHADVDHYSAMFELPQWVDIAAVAIPPQFAGRGSIQDSDARLLNNLAARGIPVHHLWAGGPLDPLPGGDRMRWEILWPPPQLPESTASNDMSIVMRISYAGFRVLLTGDIDRPAMERLLAAGTDLQADVLVLPHHGSVNPITPAFLAAVRPRWAVASSGRMGQSPPTGIETLLRDCRYMNTAEVGAIEISLGPAGLEVQGGHRRRRRVVRQGPAQPANRSWE